MIQDMLGFYNTLRKDNILVVYSGSLLEERIESYTETVRKRLAFDEALEITSMAVFSVFVEQMNNMLMYSEELKSIGNGKTYIPMGLFLIGDDEDTYFLQSGNAIKNKDIQSIREIIEHLNSLDKEGIRQLYKKQIQAENTNSNSKGAGLGLIEIAKRVSTPIEYSFTPLENELSFFTLLTRVKKGED